MKRLLFCAAAAALLVPGAAAAETLKGTISDSMCAAKHASEKQGDKAADHRACVEKCVKGGQYVFVSGDKVYKIANQDLADLKTHAAHQVVLTGDVKGETITVTKVEMPKEEKK